MYINVFFFFKIARRGTSQHATSTRPHPYPQTQRKHRPQALGRVQGRRVDNAVDNGHARNPLADEVHGEEEPEAEPEDNLRIEGESDTDQDVMAGLDIVALLNNTKVHT
jgi:hypothetical protein